MAHYSEIEAGVGYTGAAGQGMAAAGGANRRLSWRLKAVMDRLGAFVLLLAIAPLMALIALAVRIDSAGPILFRQPRFGAGRSVVLVSKFRTMHPEGTDIGGRRQATRGDDRVTRVGRFLRQTCLDELPQLWDVLCGRMSLVGPRPHPLQLEVEGQPIESLIPDYHQRHAVRPGITGLAQIRGFRGSTESAEALVDRVRADLEYVSNWSLSQDIVILLRTVKVLVHKNAY